MGVYTVNQTDGSLVRVAGGTLYADAPIGAIQSYGGVIAPAGWLICDGSAVSRTEYAELFAVIGISFGEGDGETTFGIPDLRECVPVGVGKNITKSIANHDRYDLGQFKDDALGTHNHPLVAVTTATFNNAGVPVGIGNNNTPTSATHGKQLGVNYIIKAKMVGVPADLEAQIDADYQKKDLASAVEGATTVEGALGALSTNKAGLDSDGAVTLARGVGTGWIGSTGSFDDAVPDAGSRFSVYRCEKDATNSPSTTAGSMVVATRFSANYIRQVAYVNIIAGRVYTRTYTSGTWSSWEKLVTESDITPTEITGTGTTGLGFTAKKSGNVVTVYLYCTANVSGGQSISFGTLPTDYRPPRNVKFLIHSNNGSLDSTQGMFADISSYNGGIASYSYVALASGQCGVVTYIID